MKIINILISVTFFLTFTSYSQITKGNWMVGGNASFNSTSNSLNDGPSDKSTTIIVNPNIGYFLFDNFATGIKTGFITYFRKDSPNETGYNFGPYLRYYFLKEDKRTNLFLEGNYYYGAYNTSNSAITNSYGFTAGPVIFLNSSVAIEIGLNYSNLVSKQDIGFIQKIEQSNFNALIGLQIHLEKL
jgi:hypothetical protein